MKIVVNKCFGGFGISVSALKELVMRNAECIEQYTPKHYYGGDNHKFNGNWEQKWKNDLADYSDIGDGFMAHKHAFNIHKDGILYSIKDRYEQSVRANKDLIDIVEKLGDTANGQCANLSIVEIPDDVNWEIDEYDGMETIHEKHRSWYTRNP